MGLLSGTSADAVEAALCRISGTGERVKLELVAHRSVPFEPELAARILGAETIRDACELNALIAEAFAEAALEVIDHANLEPDDVDVIGSHGQTLAHYPRALSANPSSLQVGDGALIAERTGIPVVCDFRTRDMAVGGEGAPLVPYFDWAVLRSRDGIRRAFQNLGGIANVSVVGQRLEDTLAFDTGPANMILDALSRRATGGRLSCDLDGTLSRQGQVIPELLTELLQHPFLAREPPKSAGRESFGPVLVDALWARFASRPMDLIATAAAYTVEATARAYQQWILPRGPLEAVYLSGGGSRNPTLRDGLARKVAPLPVRSVSDLGFPEEAKEAGCFALLAHECLAGTPQNVPAATGAGKRVVLGKMVP